MAAVVCGPGSILTASRVGASFNHGLLWVVALAVVLMIGMTALAARLGAIFERSVCGELARRLGRPAAMGVGLIMFLVVAGFQVGNNLAVVAALGPLLEPWIAPGWQGWLILPLINSAIVLTLYRARHLYAVVERSMKLLVALMMLAFLGNWIVAAPAPGELIRGMTPRWPTGASAAEWLAVAGLFATTFSIAGAFYQSYLVRDKGWGVGDLPRGLLDSVVGILTLGFITTIVLSTAAATFHGREGIELGTVGDVARQLEPLFGAWARWLFSVGILAGALSSFLVNAMIGGQLLADGSGLGDSMGSIWTRHGTTLVMALGMAAALAGLTTGWNVVHLIVVAQACTVVGGPALAATLLYLATRPEIRRRHPTPAWMLGLAWLGFFATVALAIRTLLNLLS